MITIASQLSAISAHAHTLDIERQEYLDTQRGIIAARAQRTVTTQEERHAAKDAGLLMAMKGRGLLTTTEIAGLIGSGRTCVFLRLRELESRKLVTRTGEQRNTKWSLK